MNVHLCFGPQFVKPHQKVENPIHYHVELTGLLRDSRWTWTEPQAFCK